MTDVARLKKILKAKIATKDREIALCGKAHPGRYEEIEIARANLEAAQAAA